MKMNHENVIKDYRVKDLYEAAFLYASGITLLGLEKSEKNFLFVFANPIQCQKLRDAFWSYKTSIDAKNYADAVKSLKERLFSNIR